MHKGSNFPTTSSTVVIFCVFLSSLPDGGEVLSHCAFDLHFLKGDQWRVDSLEKTLMLGGIGAGGEGDDRGWDGWMASPTWWTWVWVNSGSWWWTGRPGMLQFMGSQRVGHDWATELYWTEPNRKISDVLVHFVWFLAICVSCLEKCLFRYSVHFLIQLFGFFGCC